MTSRGYRAEPNICGEIPIVLTGVNHKESPSRKSEDKDGATFRGWGRGEPPGAGRVDWETGRPWHLHLRDTQRWRFVTLLLKKNWTDNILLLIRGREYTSLECPALIHQAEDHIWCLKCDIIPHLYGYHLKCLSICQCPAFEIPQGLNSRVCEIKLSGGSGLNDKG